jgi:hypothetical protein
MPAFQHETVRPALDGRPQADDAAWNVLIN